MMGRACSIPTKCYTLHWFGSLCSEPSCVAEHSRPPMKWPRRREHEGSQAAVATGCLPDPDRHSRQDTESHFIFGEFGDCTKR